MLKYKEKALNSKTFCIYPFMAVSTTTTGNVKSCCRISPDTGIGNINNNNLKDLWNNEILRDLRKKLLNGDKPDLCKTCWKHEDKGIRSMRQRSFWPFKKYLDQLDKVDDQYNMPFEIKMFEAKLSNICNLKCRMCSPADSSALFADWKKIKSIAPHLKDKNNSKLDKPIIKWNNERFWSDFKEIAPHLTILHFAGGEPLIDPSHYKIMDIVKSYAKNIQLDYSTNLSILNYKKIDLCKLWEKFKQVELSVSIDGVSDIYNYIRQNGSYNTLRSNIKEVQTYKSIIEIRGHCVFQVYNIFSLPEIFDAFVEDLNIEIFAVALSNPNYLDMRIIPINIKEKLVEKLEQYKDSIKYKTHPNWTDERKQQAINGVTEQIIELKSQNLPKKFLEEFILYSDNMDRIQNVKYTWRELLPELKYV